MLTFTKSVLALLLGLQSVSGLALNPNPYAAALEARQASNGGRSGLQVDLGYEAYQGYSNATVGLDIWRGWVFEHDNFRYSVCLLTFNSIRYAAPPTGQLRWQAPQPPVFNKSSVLPATEYGPYCPQNPDAPSISANNTGASEDCLSLNVYSPKNATGPLPVLVWIHGGGYGAGNGREDLTSIINANGNSFVGVTIQYRVTTPVIYHMIPVCLYLSSLAPLASCHQTKSSGMALSMLVYLISISPCNGCNPTFRFSVAMPHTSQ